MSHFTVLVVGNNPEEQLAPFEESPEKGSPYLKFVDRTESVMEKWEKYKNEYASIEEFADKYFGYDTKNENGKYGYMGNPNAKWDWYLLGGRWTGFFKLKPNTPGTVGKPGIMTEMADAGTADMAYKKDIDFEGMRNAAAKEAEMTYKMVSDEFDGDIPKITIRWADLIDEKNEMYNKLDIQTKREMYHSQPAMLKWKSKGNKYAQLKDTTPEFKKLYDIFIWGDLEKFQITMEEYVQKARNSAISTFAVIKDGKWYEKGEMGWWAMVSNEKSDWNSEFSKLLDSIPDDTVISVYDCHI